jgi:hypothetical protein
LSTFGVRESTSRAFPALPRHLRARHRTQRGGTRACKRLETWKSEIPRIDPSFHRNSPNPTWSVHISPHHLCSSRPIAANPNAMQLQSLSYRLKMHPSPCPVAHSACEPTAGQDPPHSPARLEIRILAFIRASVTRRRSQGVSGVSSTLFCPVSGRSSRSAPRPPTNLAPHSFNTRSTGPKNTQERAQGRANAGSHRMMGRSRPHWSRTALDIPYQRGSSCPSPGKSAAFGHHFLSLSFGHLRP